MRKHRVFLVMNGKNGATYIINASDRNSITESLKFYRALSLRSKILKVGLMISLMLKSRIFSTKFETAEEVQQFLQNLSSSKIKFGIDENCSVLVSPTRSKIIVNHHGNYFEKFAFGDSYIQVRNEANIYKLFSGQYNNFQVSNFYDLTNSFDEICSFKLSNVNVDVAGGPTFSLVNSLSEFFNITENTKITVEKYIEDLVQRLNFSELQNLSLQDEELESIKQKYKTKKFPVGLVHRDFKPWNIIEYPKILIFDFEEAITNGPPMEDLLNFYLDPIIRYQSTKMVAEYLQSEELVNYQNAYLEKLNISIDSKVFIHFYLTERMLFWWNAGENQTSKAYLKLSDYLLESRQL
ncbi:phosphotransferase [Salegentibacter holothuriorum]|uniref:phosphotransferase n=1 Tax=Salegentibacter holothuriorum TaxID=241145 RepID=UPI001116FDE1|nr:phosphotransferase [Salegentibacter holothuriorum]